MATVPASQSKGTLGGGPKEHQYFYCDMERQKTHWFQFLRRVPLSRSAIVCHGQKFDKNECEWRHDSTVELAARAELRETYPIV